MKQKKKTLNRPKSTSENYFNPYKQTSKNLGQSRNTYKQYPLTLEEKQRKKNTSTNKNTSTEKKRQVNKKTSAPLKKNKRKLPPKAPSSTLTPEQRRAQMRKKINLSQAQRMKIRKRRRYRAALRIGITMCLTIGVVWGGISLKEYFTKPVVSTQVVKMGTLDTSTQFEGVILRNEKVIYSEESGNVRYVIGEGEKVNKEGLVYVLVDEANLKTTTAAKEEVETNLYNKAENNAEVSNYQDERYNLDEEVKNRMEDFYNNRYESSTNYIYTLRNQLESSIANRTNLYTKEQETKNDELLALKEQIDADLGQYQKGKVASESGFVSYQMDGYETEDAETVIKQMTKADYQKFRKSISPNTLGQNEINTGDPIYKVVLDNDWYIVSFVKVKEAEDLIVGQTYTIHFDELGGECLDFTLLSKEEKDKDIQLTFKTNNQIGDFLEIRTVNFSIGEKAISGLKIPTQAIVEQNLIKIPVAYCFEQDHKMIVYKQSGEIAQPVEIDIQYQEDDMIYIRQDLTNLNAVQVNDVLVNKDNGTTHQVTDVETKQGVYVVNNNMAKFREVTLLVQSDEYAIVKYTSKSQLKEMDKIISNPKSIKVDQLLDDVKVQNE